MNGSRVGENFGCWRLEQMIGSGGMGDVYLGRRVDGVVAQVAAVKLLRSSHAQSSEEGDLLRCLHHPNIAACFDCGLSSDGQRYLVMEYVDGLPITIHADQRGLSVTERLELFVKACRAVEYAHQHMVAHLDLKPGNILVNSDGVVKLIDFGIARRISESDADAVVAFSGPYASPEHIQSERRLGFASDIYGLGAVLYELLCGHPPFDPLLIADELERQILEVSPRLPSQAILQPRVTASDSGRRFRLEPETSAKLRGGCRPREIRGLLTGSLDQVCLFALRKEPNRRYRSVAALQSDVEGVLRGRRPQIARSGDPMYSALRAARRHPLPMLVAVASVALPYSAWMTGRSWSAGTQISYQTARAIDAVISSTIEDLGRLRAELGPDSGLRGTAEAIATIERRTASPPAYRTFWEKFMHEGAATRARIWEIIRGK